ncbi:glutenin, high molecular weight subunit PW212-like [Penaeus japonicus]|uniref:glutenin, high molecular weight subunit PW212-like n=1 Tax=Penaeus japonicus TaxID=27405 RepID=UPI001C712EB8|nr:glutenin, high molecular weight subunit PW212-like [Penaeus japonicus]
MARTGEGPGQGNGQDRGMARTGEGCTGEWTGQGRPGIEKPGQGERLRTGKRPGTGERGQRIGKGERPGQGKGQYRQGRARVIQGDGARTRKGQDREGQDRGMARTGERPDRVVLKPGQGLPRQERPGLVGKRPGQGTGQDRGTGQDSGMDRSPLHAGSSLMTAIVFTFSISISSSCTENNYTNTSLKI